ncbi:unnamed protein product [Cyprideis torosa]|uniref:Uncharacterized protein n=1 Tax=Cyprideis torosa TaxID=163714 RepID=A0A7R8W8M8_9CRUS|nr:unnamed protein product [Cyprideis torosa]CAG0887646.1 unnamed protein product [Cyprideis torosa]
MALGDQGVAPPSGNGFGGAENGSSKWEWLWRSKEWLLQELIKRMSQASDNGVNTNSIYVDPDIIDLTMIPPPATPDDDGASKLPTGPSFPPTPFADRLSLDKELQALEDDLGDLKDLRIWNNSGLGGSTELGEGVSVASMAALAPLQYEDEEDIDSFIANVSVPPPPRSLESALMEPFSTVEHSPVVELTQDDINAFIIPPPPAGDSLELEKPIILRQKPKQPLTNGPVVKPPAPLPSEKESTGTLKLKVSAPPSEVSKQPPMSLPDRGPQASPKKRSPGRTLPTPPTEKPTLDLPTIAQRKELLLRAATNTNAEEEFPPPPTPQEDNAASRINGRELPKSPAKKIVQNPQPSHDQEDDRSPGPPIPPRSPIKGFNGPKTELRSPPSRLPPIPPEMKLVPKPPLPTKPKKAFGDQPPIEREKSSPRKLPPIPVAQNGFGKPPMPAPKPAINQALLKTVVNTSKEQAPQQPNGFHLSPVKPALKQNGLPPEPYLPNGISYECDSLETSFESESNSSEDAMQQLLGGRGRVTFAGTERHLQQVNKEMTDFSRSLTVVTPDDVQHEAYKELLTAEARQFVTASKLFVKSATETQDRLMDCLTQCVALMDRMADASKQMARHAPSVAQNDELLERVTDVGKTFLKTVQAAHRASGRNMNDPAMNTLMREATSLASALTALMKTLRVIPT